jgi:hypothetical protein
MKQHMFSLVSALLLAAPLTGTAQVQQLKPNELATNVAGATTIATPPKGFNPLNASDQDLEYYGFPPRPDQVAAPKAFATWQKAMNASRSRVTPVLEVTNNGAIPATMQAAAAPPSGSAGAATSPIWAGYVNENGATTYDSSSFYYIIADYDVPDVRQAHCDGTWDYAVTAAGIAAGDQATCCRPELKRPHTAVEPPEPPITRPCINGIPMAGQRSPVCL